MAIRGKGFDKARWARMHAFGAVLAMATISRERIVRARRDALEKAVPRVIPELEKDESLAGLSDEEVTAEVNRRFNAEPIDLSEVIESAEKEVQAIVNALGRKYKIKLGHTTGGITVETFSA